MELIFDTLESPIGTVVLVSRETTLCALDFSDYDARMRTLIHRRFGVCELTRASDPNGFTQRLQNYFDGNPAALDDIEVDTGGTPFQRSVWIGLRQIPLGETASYGELAAKVGRPAAARAVGYANSLNPIGIVLPCHRVIGSNGSLTGYAGGIHRKEWLLNHERVMVRAMAAAS